MPTACAQTIEHIKAKLPQAFVIAGNVATPEAVIDLENWGADATKVGVGPGKVCITKLKTGFGTGGWQLSALKWCAAWPPSPSSPTAASATTATSPRACASAPPW
jgi:GMP reductase